MAEKDLGTETSRVLQNKNTGYDSVVWNKLRPPLDSELNLMGDIRSNSMRNVVNYLSQSGVVKPLLPAITSDPNTYYVHSDPSGEILPVLLNGWALSVGAIDSDQLSKIKVTLPAPDVARDDLVFLEVWTALVQPDSDTNKPSSSEIYRFGNTQFVPGSTYTNISDEMIDEDIGFATTFRVQVQYRLRVTQHVAFLYVTPSGDLNALGMEDPIVQAQGQLLTPASGYTFRPVSSYNSTIFVAGDGNPDNGLSVDGLVYALPLQKVHRRPSSDPTSDEIKLTDITNLASPVIARGLNDHGLLQGLEDDDHPQYLTSARHFAIDHSFVSHSDLQDLSIDSHSMYLNRLGRSVASSNYIETTLTIRTNSPTLEFRETDASLQYRLVSDFDPSPGAQPGGVLRVDFTNPDDPVYAPNHPNWELGILSLSPCLSTREPGTITGELSGVEVFRSDVIFSGSIEIGGNTSAYLTNRPSLRFKSPTFPFTYRIAPSSIDGVASDGLQIATDKSLAGTFNTCFEFRTDGGTAKTSIISYGSTNVEVSKDTILSVTQKSRLTSGGYATDDGTSTGVALHTHPSVGLEVSEDGVSQGTFTGLNFTGAGVSTSENDNEIDINIPAVTPKVIYRIIPPLEVEAPASNETVVEETFTLNSAGGAVVLLWSEFQTDEVLLAYKSQFDNLSDSPYLITADFVGAGSGGTIENEFPSGNDVHIGGVTIVHPCALDAGEHTWRLKVSLNNDGPRPGGENNRFQFDDTATLTIITWEDSSAFTEVTE